ncbi:MAG: hypothetical protein H8D78_08640 [Chloroflexi bacterium]|nr:hypothetical protein [Chloroflexota bacterium]
MPTFVFEWFLVVFILILAVLLAGERMRHALLHHSRTVYALGLQQLALQRAGLGRSIVVPPESLLVTVSQIAFDVLGERAEVDQLFDVHTDAPLSMTFAHQQRRFFTFTPQPERARQLYPGGRWFIVDGLTAHPFVAEELTAAFATALSNKRPGEQPLLPRSEQWTLVVWERPAARRRWPWPLGGAWGGRRRWLQRAREVGA